MKNRKNPLLQSVFYNEKKTVIVWEIMAYMGEFVILLG